MLLNLRGDPHVLARGIAIGLAINFIPTIGLGLPVVYWAAAMVRGHKVAAVISTMTIKAIFPLLYILNYIVGVLVLEGHLEYTLDWNVAIKAGMVFFLGSAINFLIAFAVSYFASMRMITAYRAKIMARRARC
jgi:uncharacterized protein (DUF2062 family)